ncbi:MAG: polysaccharide deacetylase family protein [Bacillota bacterium]|nr:polysaccharide deacetylase family protein [Bacillota bacterium]
MKYVKWGLASSLLFLFVGCQSAPLHESVGKKSSKNPTGIHNQFSASSANNIEATNLEKNSLDYILPIKGTSEKLSKSSWQKIVQWRQEILSYPKTYPGEVFLNGPNKKRVALTFDDGPDRINTPKIIQALQQRHVKATFFFIGQKVEQNPEIVMEAYKNGNVIGNHSFYHHFLPKETESEIKLDLEKTSSAIRKIINKTPLLLRPPYGATDTKVVTAASKDHNKIILWSLDTLDWSLREHVPIQKNVFDNIRNGDIILMHSNEDKKETAKAVPLIIDELTRRGFQLVDVATLLDVKPYQ